MKQDVIMPRLGSSDESDEVRILRWIKSQGESVKKGDQHNHDSQITYFQQVLKHGISADAGSLTSVMKC